jgi:hypothetical protein
VSVMVWILRRRSTTTTVLTMTLPRVTSPTALSATRFEIDHDDANNDDDDDANEFQRLL